MARFVKTFNGYHKSGTQKIAERMFSNLHQELRWKHFPVHDRDITWSVACATPDQRTHDRKDVKHGSKQRQKHQAN